MASALRLGGRPTRRSARTLLAVCAVAAAATLTTPARVAASVAAPTLSCTFDGKAGPAPITGVVPGKARLTISCTGAAGLGVAAVMASPIGGVVVSPASATSDADVATLTLLTEKPAGTYRATFAVPATFHATDPNAKCPPTPGQFNAGLVGCAVAVINTSNLSPFPNAEAIMETTAQVKRPNAPTLATATNVVTPGEHLTFADATGACTDKLGASSQCWWGDGLAGSSSSASPATMHVTLDGKTVAGAVAVVAGPGVDGRSTYDGTTLVPQLMSGAITLPGAPRPGATP